MNDDGKKIPEIIPEILIEPIEPEEEKKDASPDTIPEITPALIEPVAEPVAEPVIEPISEPASKPAVEPTVETIAETGPDTSSDIPEIPDAVTPEFQTEPEPEPEPVEPVLDSNLDVPAGDTLMFEDPFENNEPESPPPPEVEGVPFVLDEDDKGEDPAAASPMEPVVEPVIDEPVVPVSPEVTPEPEEEAAEIKEASEDDEPEQLDEFMEIDETPASGLDVLIVDEAPPRPEPAPEPAAEPVSEPLSEPVPEFSAETVQDGEPEDSFDIIDETPAGGLDGMIIDDAPAGAPQSPKMFADDEPAVVWKKPPVEPEAPVPADTDPGPVTESVVPPMPETEPKIEPEQPAGPPPLPDMDGAPAATPEPDTFPPAEEITPQADEPDSQPTGIPPAPPVPEPHAPKPAEAPEPPEPEKQPDEPSEPAPDAEPKPEQEPEPAETGDAPPEEEGETAVPPEDVPSEDAPPEAPPIDADTAEAVEAGWAVTDPDPACCFALCIGHELYLIKGGEVRLVDNVDDLDEHINFIADYPTAPGPQSTIIDGPAKFAPVLLRKKLQEEGELTDEYTLVTFQQEKISAQRTRISYELMPNASYTGQMNNAVRTKQGYMLHNTASFLLGLLMGLKAKKGAGLALHLPGHIIALAGKNGKIHFARRYALAGEDEFSLRSGMANMHQDLVGLNTRGELEIPHIEWIEGLSKDLLWPQINFDLPVMRQPVTPLEMDGERWWTSIPSVLDKVSPNACLGPKTDIRMLPFAGLEKWLWGVLGLAGPALLVLAVMMNMTVAELTQKTSDLALGNRYLNEELNNEVKTINALSRTEADFMEVKGVAEKIKFAGAVPPIAAIWQELANIKPAQCHLSSIHAQYGKDGVTTSLTGSLSTGILRTQAVFTDFLAALEGAGWNVDSKSVVLDVNDNTFSLSLTKKYKGS